MIKTIVFDWGNVLAFYPMDEFRENMSKELNVDKDLFSKVELENRLKHDLGEITTDEFIANLNKALNLNLTKEYYYSLLKKFNLGELNTDLLNYAQQLKKHYKIIVLSNNSPPVYEEIMNSDLKDLFDKLVFSFQYGIKKPNIEFFKKIEEPFEECVFIDDREDLCQAAESYGFKVILFKNTEQVKRELNLLLGGNSSN